MRGSMSLSVSPLMDSMIWPFLILPVAAAGDPASTSATFMVNAGWIRSIDMPTGPNRLRFWIDFFSDGRVEKSDGFL